MCVCNHRPVIVKRILIGSKGGWKLSTIFKMKSVSWLVNNTGKKSYLLDGYIFAALFETTYVSLLLLIKFTGVAEKKGPILGFFFNEIFLSCKTWRSPWYLILVYWKNKVQSVILWQLHSRLAIDRSACILTRPAVITGFNESLLVDWGILRCKDTEH